MTKEQLALKALRNAVTRARTKPVADQAVETLLAGIATAELWLTEQHPQQVVAQ